jgi:hypothetical protein
VGITATAVPGCTSYPGYIIDKWIVGSDVSEVGNPIVFSSTNPTYPKKMIYFNLFCCYSTDVETGNFYKRINVLLPSSCSSPPVIAVTCGHRPVLQIWKHTCREQRHRRRRRRTRRSQVMMSRHFDIIQKLATQLRDIVQMLESLGPFSFLCFKLQPRCDDECIHGIRAVHAFPSVPD